MMVLLFRFAFGRSVGTFPKMYDLLLPLEDDEDANKPHSFPWKLHEMLQDADRNKFTQVVSWQLDGTAFKVHNHGEFLRTIMPQYFDQTKYESFRRQLNLYGFTRVSRGANRGIYMHPYFVQHDPSLCQHVLRTKHAGKQQQ